MLPATVDTSSKNDTVLKPLTFSCAPTADIVFLFNLSFSNQTMKYSGGKCFKGQTSTSSCQRCDPDYNFKYLLILKNHYC